MVEVVAMAEDMSAPGTAAVPKPRADGIGATPATAAACSARAAPEPLVVDAPRREAPDVSTGEVIAAGATQEAIETDYWWLTDRERAGYHQAADRIAAELGYELPAYAAETGGLGAMSLPRMGYEEGRLEVLLRARREHPEAFKDVPITEPEIVADVNAKLRAEWDDAAKILDRAPDGFLGRLAPEFLGRMGPAATDQVNAPLALMTLGTAPAASLGRMMLVEGAIGMLGEAGTLPRQFEVADRLDLPEPNAAAQLAFGALVGAAFPAAVRGTGQALKYGGRTVGLTNRELVRAWRKRAPSPDPAARAAVNAVERQVAEESVGPAARGIDQPGEIDRAAADMDAGNAPAEGVPPVDSARVEDLVVPPRLGAAVDLEFDLGPARPNPPAQEVQDVLTASAEEVFGPGARVVIFSGRETDIDGDGVIGREEQHGSDRHGTGLAADARVYDAEGTLIRADDPRAQAFLRSAARNGAKGLGAGPEYMGGAGFHVDLVPHAAHGPGQDAAWGALGNRMQGELEGLMQGGQLPSAAPVEENLRNLVRDAEGWGYDTPSSYSLVAPDKPLSQMTLDEVDAWQAANIAAGAESTAAGGYQILRATLQEARGALGLSGDTLFSRATQDQLADWLMQRRGLDDFKAGRISAEEFADNLAGEWAAFPRADGRSVYAGDGLNAARVERGLLLSVIGGQPYSSIGRPPPRMSRVPASGVAVDPRTYQFRTDVDGAGVGAPLDRVTEWDELLAGDFIIHERLDGGRYIADGHHRKQLAARLEGEGHAPIEFNAFVLREADGYSVEQVRAIAAVKNIEAGNATAIDAAKVLRVDPDMLAKLTLRSSHARDARGLMRLSDDAFDMVTNRLVPENYAAFVGEITADPVMQEAVLRALMGAAPRSMAEARQVARDAMRAGLARRDADAQGSLFGDDFDMAETLFKERAQVLARTLTALRNERRVFATLVRESDRIKEAGNELTDDANTARLSADELALDLVERLVNRAGPIDDALNAAARTARAGGVKQGVGEFLAAVRGALEGSDINRLLDGGDGGRADARAADAGADEGPGQDLNDPPPGDQGDMFAGGGLLGNAFDDPAPDAPAVAGQIAAAENDLRQALEAGGDFDVPTGRVIDGAPETVTAGDLMADLDADDDFLGALDVCKA